MPDLATRCQAKVDPLRRASPLDGQAAKADEMVARIQGSFP
ncbi:MAG: hypothetical protein PV358_11490 [Acidimicrobiales bacterium]|nr:hypothetical protein [Acidimicrobiales bacterium]